VLEALDRALLESGLLKGGRILLAGSSAGAWRMMTFAAQQPLECHRRLLHGYVRQVFPPGASPEMVSAAYRDLLHDLLHDELDHLLAHPTFDLAIHTSRLRRGRSKAAFIASFLAAAVFRPLTSRSTDFFFERVLFHSRPTSITTPFTGRVVVLNHDNLLDAVLASGTVPIYLQPVSNPAGAPQGMYLDGGLLDYHVRQDWIEEGDGLVLLPHYQQSILPRWLDRFVPWHSQPQARATADLLQIYPSPELFSRLPDAQAPDRRDFTRFAHQPEVRLQRWHESLRICDALGEELREDLALGRISERIKPLQ
jgi:hypothetical protein